MVYCHKQMADYCQGLPDAESYLVREIKCLMIMVKVNSRCDGSVASPPQQLSEKAAERYNVEGTRFAVGDNADE